MKYPNSKLYILVRDDIDSLTPGKAMAQCAHAANLCERLIARSKNKVAKAAWKEWEGNRGFGTTIVLNGGSIFDIEHFLDETLPQENINGVVEDPTYPVRDGEVTHLVKVKTVGFFFAPNTDTIEGNTFELHSREYQNDVET
jgi:peptidyl-tRNA hydrolase